MESFCGTTDVDPDHHLFAHWVSFIIRRKPAFFTGSLPAHAPGGAVAGGVVEGYFGGGGVAHFRPRDVERESFLAAVAHAVVGLLDDFANAVVEDDFNAIEQRKRVAATDRNDDAVTIAAGGGLEDFWLRVVDQEIVGFKGGREAVANGARRGLGRDETGEVDTVRQMRAVELGEAIAGVGRNIGPGGVAVAADGKGAARPGSPPDRFHLRH